MHLTVKTARRKTINHDGTSFLKTDYINRGEKYLQISNGTIGAGARARNIDKASAIELLTQLIDQLNGCEYECDQCGIGMSEDDIENSKELGLCMTCEVRNES
jgi:hypothetical protein